MAAARRHRFPADRLIFELTEDEEVVDHAKLGRIFHVYRAHSFRTALDDFGAGFSGLSLLAHFQPDVVKIDLSLLRGLDADARRHAIVGGIIRICRDLIWPIIRLEARASKPQVAPAGGTAARPRLHNLRIPMHSAHPYRFQTAHRSNLKPPTIPISNRPPF